MNRFHRHTVFEALGRHPIHPFPARMAPGIALDALTSGTKQLRVLDPMSGSGTVLAVARANGHRAIGVDIDPLAVLLARVWTTSVDRVVVSRKALEVLRRAKDVFRDMSDARAYPRNADTGTKKFLRYWFDPYVRRQLTALSVAIGRVRDDGTRDVLWSAMSRLIITKQAGASLAMDLSHSRPHKVFRLAPVKPFDRFIAAVETVIANCPVKGSGRIGPPTILKVADARTLPIPTATIDLILTSPPYLNAIDYLRCSKFSLVWMGFTIEQLRIIRSESVGTESSSIEALEARWVESIIAALRLKPALAPRHHAMLAQYVWDMDRAAASASRVLRPDGHAIYVVGDSVVRGTFVRNSKVVALCAARHGLTLMSQRMRTLPANRRYLPDPTAATSASGLNVRMRREVVMKFCKAS